MIGKFAALPLASGSAANLPITDPLDPLLDDFRTALGAVTRNLATQIVRDGEGATKLITIDVAGADNNKVARVLLYYYQHQQHQL